MAITVSIDIASELRQVPGFEEVTEDAVRELAAAATQRQVSAGFEVLEQGIPSQNVVALIRGAAKMIRRSSVDGADPVVIDVMRAPSFIYDVSSMDGQASTAGVITLRSSHLIFFEAAAVKSLLPRSPALARFFILQAAKSVRAHVRRIDELVSGSVDERVKHLLDSLARGHGTPHGQGRFVALPLRRRDIACMVNATTETVSRLLAKFEREGMVRSTRDGIWVRTRVTPPLGIDMGPEIKNGVLHPPMVTVATTPPQTDARKASK
jgi:CRP-like cAMP-binding protein